MYSPNKPKQEKKRKIEGENIPAKGKNSVEAKVNLSRKMDSSPFQSSSKTIRSPRGEDIVRREEKTATPVKKGSHTDVTQHGDSNKLGESISLIQAIENLERATTGLTPPEEEDIVEKIKNAVDEALGIKETPKRRGSNRKKELLEIETNVWKWLDEIEEENENYKDIKGKDEGLVKNKVREIKEAIKKLIDRTGGEEAYWKEVAMNQEKEIDLLKKKVKKLENNIEEIKSQQNNLPRETASKRKRPGETGDIPKITESKTLNPSQRYKITDTKGWQGLKKIYSDTGESETTDGGTNKMSFNKDRYNYKKKYRTRETTVKNDGMESKNYNRNLGRIEDNFVNHTNRYTQIRRGSNSSSNLNEHGRWIRQRNLAENTNRRMDRTEIYTNKYIEDENNEYDMNDTRNQERVRRVNLRNTSVVTMFCGVSIGYAEALRIAKHHINIQNLDVINNMNIRRAVTGGLIFEIQGKDQIHKADRLAEELKNVFKDKEVYINRPIQKTEFIISGLDDSITEQEVQDALVRICGQELGAGKVGRIRKARDGMGQIWIQCPSTMAARICAENKIRIGWSWAKIEILKKRPLKCYKCLATGHVRQNCYSEIDRKGTCFNCGETGHHIGECRNRSYCPQCYEKGLSYMHRTGSYACDIASVNQTYPRNK